MYALVSDLATGIGAIPFFFIKDIKKKILGFLEALAGGLMMGASFNLIFEGINLNILLLNIGMILGILLVVASNNFLNGKELALGNIRGISAKRAILFLFIMTAHSFAEGIAIGVSFGGRENLGILTSVAIAIHNIPEGLAISLYLISQGASPIACLFWSIFSSLPQPIMAVPSYILVEIFKPILPFGFGFAAGAMIYLVLWDIIPSSLKSVSQEFNSITIILGTLLMITFYKLL
ncbi:MAG: ZIP family metal transporter [candidate division WOR-3 bacterium]|nr:ZIP family metal transporter [candidate division WOR-3 bacterium]MDW8149921.1 ZIP family metal transporter [candidate division WOR-3 bacterium]